MRVWNLFAILFPVMVFSSFRVPSSPRMLLLLLLSHRMDVVFCKHLDELAFCNGIVQVSKDVNPCLLHSWNLLGSKLPLFPVRGWSSRFISFIYTVYIYIFTYPIFQDSRNFFRWDEFVTPWNPRSLSLDPGFKWQPGSARTSVSNCIWEAQERYGKMCYTWMSQDA